MGNSDEQEARLARAAVRRLAGWPIRRVPLGDEGREAPDARSPAELVASLWALTLDAWASTGRPLPAYERDQTPGRVVRRGG